MGEVYLDYNYIKDLDFLKRMPNLKVAHLGTPDPTQPTTISPISIPSKSFPTSMKSSWRTTKSRT